MNPGVLIALGVGLFFLLVWLLKWLWNITMPSVFNLKSITYWQAFRLLLIAVILFGRPQSKWEGKQKIKESVKTSIQEKFHREGALEPSKEMAK